MKEELGFKTIFVHKKALTDGFEAYMVERSLQKAQEHLEFSNQQLHCITGAGNFMCGKQGVFSVFITLVLT